MGTAQMKVKGLDLEGKLTTVLLEQIKGQMAPGIKTVYAVFNFSDKKMTVSPNPATTTLTITREDARVNYTGTYIGSTGGDSKSWNDDGKILLKATIQDITAVKGDYQYDPYAGDIRNARVRFLKGSTPITNWLIPELTNWRDSKTGVVSAKWSVDGSSKDVPNDIRIEVGGDGYYERSSSSDISVVTLYKPSGDYIAGGGYLINPAGVFKGTPGLKTNFGFVVRFKYKGSSPEGSMDFIFRATENGSIRTYQANSTSISNVAVNDVSHYGKTALIIAKVNLTEITDAESTHLVGSNLDLVVRLTDNGEYYGSDRIAISLWNQGTLMFSSNWNHILTMQTQLSDGNLYVHSGFNFGNVNDNQSDNDHHEHMLAAEIGVKAYPNPFTDHVYFDLTLKTDSKVRLEIFDINGSKIATIYDDVVIAYNSYRLEYTPKNLSSNTLMYRLIIDDKIAFTGKLIHK
jgi:hypothetical protein